MMRKSLVLAAVFVLAVSVAANAAWLDPELVNQLATADADEKVSIFVTLNDEVDLEAIVKDANARHLSLEQRHYNVISALQEKAAETQEGLINRLEQDRRLGLVSDYRTFWIQNAVGMTVKSDYITKRLVNDKSIKSIYFDYPIEVIAPTFEAPADPPSLLANEGGIDASNAPDLWALGFDGTGTLACDQDTGADGTHSAFASRWRGLDSGVSAGEAWFDPNGSETFPTDSGTHGTHTLGTIVGSGGIGMAPGAKWIGAKTIDVPGGNILTDAVAAFQWSADPDGNPGTFDDVPDVVNNSWGLPRGFYGSCRADFNSAIDAAEAAGVVVVFAAGNEGSSAETLRSPGNRITSQFNSFAIGALNQNNTSIASFSSRGPSDCDGATIKPEISAVGVNVRSAAPGGGYSTKSGTSMATPHVAGAVLLLRDAFPNATPEDIKFALWHTATDLGDTGEDNTYGNGAMDVYAAYLYLADGSGDPCAQIVQDYVDLCGADYNDTYNTVCTVNQNPGCLSTCIDLYGVCSDIANCYNTSECDNPPGDDDDDDSGGCGRNRDSYSN
ncbi:MAG: S8 family serine peptidase [Deltaproteobacteria bacterium]|nr:S8 family serine peptidase [bacterium]MCB9475246.1 S8 family serine peptidase [Deltaproteobacteria bacterium]MCB9479482.1 S8 family serine peptidase [Deltaproteobacteria bacterium]MCB9489635.1 S8 family serine peptidase [Deltaproteobacteria bacterium]